METFPTDYATWLLGRPIALTKLEPSELSLEPIRADSLIFLEGEDVILHIESQTQPQEELFFRLLDYRVRLYRRSPPQTSQAGGHLPYPNPIQFGLSDQLCHSRHPP
jgi:predicted transposase/invertase (TIGR01784 family)